MSPFPDKTIFLETRNVNEKTLRDIDLIHIFFMVKQDQKNMGSLKINLHCTRFFPTLYIIGNNALKSKLLHQPKAIKSDPKMSLDCIKVCCFVSK